MKSYILALLFASSSAIKINNTFGGLPVVGAPGPGGFMKTTHFSSSSSSRSSSSMTTSSVKTITTRTSVAGRSVMGGGSLPTFGPPMPMPPQVAYKYEHG